MIPSEPRCCIISALWVTQLELSKPEILCNVKVDYANINRYKPEKQSQVYRIQRDRKLIDNSLIERLNPALP